jgi:GTP-binding protein
VSFRREKFVPRGGPDGGDGGRGGHVILKADKNVDSLLPLYYQPHQKADKGGNGLGKDCHGRNARDLYVKVPCGTIVTNQETGERIGELTEHDQEMMVCRGGKGGLGNARFATSSHQTPYESTPGEEGQSLTLQLELKIMADVGLVGYPNAGKSTLLSGLSHAHPKIAAYPFTTLNPIIGTVIFDDYQYLRIADIPGLIDGAHEGVGLGHDFLRHIERTRFLIFVIRLMII